MTFSLRTAIGLLEMLSETPDVCFSEAERERVQNDYIVLSREIAKTLDEMEASADLFEQARAAYLRRLLARLAERANTLIFAQGGLT